MRYIFKRIPPHITEPLFYYNNYLKLKNETLIYNFFLILSKCGNKRKKYIAETINNYKKYGK